MAERRNQDVDMSKFVAASSKTDLKRGVDYIGVSVCFVVHDGNGNILLQKRSKNCRDEQGMWDIGGGALEFGENLEEAVRREVKEELRAEALDVQFIKSFEALRDNKGTSTHWVAFAHVVLVDPKTIAIGEPDKVDEIAWFNSKTLPSPLHSQFYKSFDAARMSGIIH